MDQQDRLITLKECASLTSYSYRTLEQACTSGRFKLEIVRPTPRTVRVRLSDVMAVMRGERMLMDSEPFTEENKARLRERQRVARAAKKAAGGK